VRPRDEYDDPCHIVTGTKSERAEETDRIGLDERDGITTTMTMTMTRHGMAWHGVAWRGMAWQQRR